MDSERIRYDDSLFENSINGNIESIEIIFRDFISLGEKILYCNYFGIRGVFGFGGHTWGCVTEKRVAVLELEPFRKVLYKDAFHKRIDYGIIYQPNYIGIIIFLVIMTLLWLATLVPILEISMKGIMKFIHEYIHHYSYSNKKSISMLIYSILTGFSLPFIWYVSTRGYYRLVKYGLIFKIRSEGLYLFSRKKFMPRVLEFYKCSMSAKANCE